MAHTRPFLVAKELVQTSRNEPLLLNYIVLLEFVVVDRRSILGVVSFLACILSLLLIRIAISSIKEDRTKR
jgi:hypothetical protein